MSILKSGVNYRVKFQADICLPHKGQQIANAPVLFRSKIGINAELKPLKFLLPRDLHIGNPEFEAIGENDMLDLEVLGAEFKQNDESIFVLAKLLKRTPSAAPSESAAPPAIEVPTIEGASAGAGAGSGGEEVKSVVFKQPSEGELSAAAVPGPRRRKKLLKPTTAVITDDGAVEAAPGPTGPE